MNITAQMALDRLRASVHQDGAAPPAVPTRTAGRSSSDPVVRMLRAQNPLTDPTDPEAIARANELLAGALDLLATPLSPEQLDTVVGELLVVFAGSATELLAAVRSRFVEGRAYQPGANAAAELEVARVAFGVLEFWAGEIQTGWERTTFAASPELELAISRRLETAIASGGLATLLDTTLRATDETTQRCTARLLLSQMLTLNPKLVGTAQQFIDATRPPDVHAALAVLSQIGKYRDSAMGVASMLAG